MQRVNRTTGLLLVMLVFFMLYPPVFSWVNRTAIALSLLPVFYIAYHYSFIFSTIAIALLIPLNLGLVFVLGGNEQMQIMNWNNFWATHIAFFCMGFATQYVNGLKNIIKLELEERKQLQIQLKKQIHAVQKANDSKDHLLLAISHDLRTPVCAVIEMADLLINEPEAAKKDAYCDIIHQSALGFLDSINDLLNTHRDSIETSYLRFDVESLLKHILQLFRPLFDKKNLILTYHSPNELPPFYGKGKMLRQVIFNLLDNSLKNTSQGEVVVSVTAIATDAVSRVLKISIADSGSGMPESVKQAILSHTGSFAPRPNSAESYGLGLNHCLWLIGELNGVLDIQSELGLGSTFCVEIPLTIAAEVEIDKATFDVIKAVDQPVPGLSVLLVEDQAVYAEALRQKFKLLNVECHWAKSAQQAHRMLSDATFDLILLDTQLPDSPDGIIVNKLDKERTETLFPPTVIISGNVHGKAIIKWMNQGANLILNKPIAMQEISQLLALYQQNHDFPMDENARLIDKAFLLNEIQILGAEQVYKLINIFLDTTPSALETICQAFAMQKFNDCARSLHQHKSALSNLGLTGLTDLATQAEKHCKQQQRIELSFSLYQLVQASGRVEQQLQTFLQKNARRPT